MKQQQKEKATATTKNAKNKIHIHILSLSFVHFNVAVVVIVPFRLKIAGVAFQQWMCDRDGTRRISSPLLCELINKTNSAKKCKQVLNRYRQNANSKQKRRRKMNKIVINLSKKTPWVCKSCTPWRSCTKNCWRLSHTHLECVFLFFIQLELPWQRETTKKRYNNSISEKRRKGGRRLRSSECVGCVLILCMMHF